MANRLNQYTAVTGLTPSFNDNGNFKGDGTWTYGYDMVAEYDAAGTLQRRYVHGPDEPLVVYEGASTSNKNWLYVDRLGGIVGTANAAGASTGVYS